MATLVESLNKIGKQMSNNHIYQVPGQGGGMMGEADCARPDIEQKFVDRLASIVCEVMDVNHNERRIVSSLLKRSLKEEINNNSDRRPGMLQQYYAHELEETVSRLRRDLKIPNDVKINHDNGTHAKLIDITRFIQENWVRKDDINSDGTFETIFEKECEVMDIGMDEDCGDQCESAG